MRLPLQDVWSDREEHHLPFRGLQAGHRLQPRRRYALVPQARQIHGHLPCRCEGRTCRAEGRSGSSILDSVSKGMPQLMQGYKIQKKAAKVGFDWDNVEDVYAKVSEEIEEVKQAQNQEQLEEEIGDLLFSVVNLARKYKVDPTLAMERANEKFRKRFAFVEQKMSEEGLALDKENFQKMDDFWNESKRNVEN